MANLSLAERSLLQVAKILQEFINVARVETSWAVRPRVLTVFYRTGR